MLYIFHDGINWTDLPTQWRICAYTLKGINIYSLRGSSDFLPEIGYIYAGFHASPWGCLLQNIFYGGFLRFEVARYYFLAANSFVLALASYVLSAKTSSLKIKDCVLVTSLLSLDFFISLHEGNAGGMVCAFLIMAWLLCDEHEYISGVLIAFAMIKPQDALIVCILMLVMKKIKPLVVGAVIDISAWGIVSFLTGKSMFELLNEFLFMPGRTGHPPFAGIFTILTDNFYAAAAMSMIAGIIFAVALYMLLSDGMPEIFKAYPAFMTVTFWCYSHWNDCYVLVLPACLCLWLMLQGRRGIFWLLCGIWCSSGLVIKSVITRLILFFIGEIRQGEPYIRAYLQAKTLYELVIIIIGIFACLELRRIYSESRP